MSVRTVAAFCAVVCAAVAMTADATASRINAGLWNIKTKTTAPGMPSAEWMTVQACVTPAEAAKDTPSMGQLTGCKLSNVKTTPGSYSADAFCPGNPSTKGHFDYTFGSNHWTGKSVMSMSMGGQTSTITTLIDSTLVSPNCGKVK